MYPLDLEKALEEIAAFREQNLKDKRRAILAAFPDAKVECITESTILVLHKDHQPKPGEPPLPNWIKFSVMLEKGSAVLLDPTAEGFPILPPKYPYPSKIF